MINVLIPCMGKSAFFKDYFFPKILYEINGKTMLEKTIDNFSSLTNKRMIFVFPSEECKQFHVDESAKLLAGPESFTLCLDSETKGALCTCLMAVDQIDSEDPLIISNYDQIIDVDFAQVIQSLQEDGADAGVIVFNDVHPRWSYARLEKGKRVIEVAEKRPLSNQAIAGFYYFRRGSDFVQAAGRAILKGSSTDGAFYISSSLNELILANKEVLCYAIKKEQYHSFYSPGKITEYLRDEKK